MKSDRWLVVLPVVMVAAMMAAETWMGRLPLGPDGHFGWWESNIYSSEQSQRVVDPYSFSHVVHGFLFYLAIWLVARRAPLKYRLVAAIALEAGWEVLENSPVVINRYRAATIALGYDGDSILNSTSDVVMMVVGFVLAARLRPWTSVALVAVLEIGMLVLIRDNLTLNVLMLVYPLEAVRQWQLAARPAG